MLSFVVFVAISMLSKRALRSRVFHNPLVMHMYSCFAALMFLLPHVMRDFAAIRTARDHPMPSSHDDASGASGGVGSGDGGGASSIPVTL